MGRMVAENDDDGVRVFLTPSLREARHVEAVLDGHGLEYDVRVEPCGTTLFGAPRQGAAFYVRASQADYCRSQLTLACLELGVLLAEKPGAPE